MKRFQIVFTLVVFLAIAAGVMRERLRPGPEERFDSGAFHPVALEPLVPPAGALTLSGTVETAAGAPAPDVQVTLLARASEEPLAQPLHWTFTDETGRFTLEHLAAGSYRVVLVAPPAPPGSFDLVLPHDGEVTWRLSAPLPPLPVLPEIERRALAGVLALPDGLDAYGESSVAGYEVVLRPAAGTPELSGATLRRAISDSTGRFRFEELVHARYTLEVLPPWARGGSWPVLATLELEVASHVPTGEPRLVLAIGELTGRLIDAEGRPLEGALVEVFALDAPDAAGLPRGWPPTVTDAEGRFRIGNLPAGAYRLRLRAGGGKREIEVRVEPGRRTELPLEPLDPRA